MTRTNSSGASIAGGLPWVNLPAWSRAGQMIVPLALAAVLAVALLIRFDILILQGGIVADQLAWARQNYLGGITSVYLVMRDSMLAWTVEERLWPYLPGYPAFLAGLHAIGVKDLASVRVIQAVIDAFAVLPLYFVVRSIGCTTAAALVASLAYAMAPWMSASSTYLLGESLLPALILLVLTGMVLVRDRASLPAWFLIGFLSSILPFFRSDMILLIGPLVIWALLVSPSNRRMLSSVSIAVGFMLPLLLWGARNYHVHGVFILTPPGKWYAAWSGLGQVANGFGYFVDDQRARELLTSKAFPWNSIQSEAYWHAEYLKAWADHPGHVIRTILFRFRMILAQLEPRGITPASALWAYTVMAFVTPVVLAWLLYRRRWADAFLIALPMAYALGSLGFLYVEFRYIRYAGITYIFASAVVLSQIENFSRAVWQGGERHARLRHLVPIVAGVVLLAVCIGALSQLRALTRLAEAEGSGERLDTASRLPALGLEELSFQPAASGVGIEINEATLRLQAEVPDGSYMALAPLPVREYGAIVIRYHLAVQRGGIGLGVLSGTGARWLSHQVVEDGATDGRLVSRVEPGSKFVINAQSSQGIEVDVSKLSFTCVRPANVFRLLFGSRPIPASECSSTQVN